MQQPGRNRTIGPAPTQVSTPSPELSPEPLVDHLIENFDSMTNTPAAGQSFPQPVDRSSATVNPGDLSWELSSQKEDSIRAGDEFSLTLDLDPQIMPSAGSSLG